MANMDNKLTFGLEETKSQQSPLRSFGTLQGLGKWKNTNGTLQDWLSSGKAAKRK